MFKLLSIPSTLFLLMMSGVALADLITLDFEDILVTHPSTEMPLVQDFYAGGSASNTRSGVDYGIGFSDSAMALCLNTLDSAGNVALCSNASRGGEGDPDSAQTAAYFTGNSDAYINIADGFMDMFSFYYSASISGSLVFYDGLNGSGNAITAVDLLATPVDTDCIDDYQAGFCGFVYISVALDDLVKSISFNDATDWFVFDDVSFGSADQPIAATAPGAALPILVSLCFLYCRRRRAAILHQLDG